MDGREAPLLLGCFVLEHVKVKKETETTRESDTKIILTVRVNYIWSFPCEFHLGHFFPPRISHML